MKLICSNRNRICTLRPASQSAGTRPLVLAAVSFALGVAITGAWFIRQNIARHSAGLSAQTQSALAHLPAPVKIRFYSMLPTGCADNDLTNFTARVDQLLTDVQQAGQGKIQVDTVQSVTETNETEADNQGIQRFNLVKDDACYLGLVISSGASKQILPRLQPEWEAALPYDLARAVLAVADASVPPVPPSVAKPAAEITATIARLIPDVKTVTPEQADQILHAEYLKQCEKLSAEAQAQIQAAQQQVAQAQTGGSATELEAAQKNLSQVQLAQAEKLKQLAAQLDIQLAVFKRMKTESDQNPK